MANKSTLISNINGFISSVVDIAKHRSSMLEIVNSLFQTTYVLSNTPAPDQITYNLRFKKIGNLVYIDGTIKNDFSFMIGTQIVASITNSEYNAKTGQDTTIPVVGTTTLQNGIVKISLDDIILNTNLGAGNTIVINGHYQTND